VINAVEIAELRMKYIVQNARGLVVNPVGADHALTVLKISLTKQCLSDYLFSR